MGIEVGAAELPAESPAKLSLAVRRMDSDDFSDEEYGVVYEPERSTSASLDE